MEGVGLLNCPWSRHSVSAFITAFITSAFTFSCKWQGRRLVLSHALAKKKSSSPACQYLVNTFLVAFLKFIEIFPALFTCPFYVDGQLWPCLFFFLLKLIISIYRYQAVLVLSVIISIDIGLSPVQKEINVMLKMIEVCLFQAHANSTYINLEITLTLVQLGQTEGKTSALQISKV